MKTCPKSIFRALMVHLNHCNRFLIQIKFIYSIDMTLFIEELYMSFI